MKFAVPLLFWAGACGRVGFDAHLTTDGGTDAATLITGDSAPSCDIHAPFSAPVPIAELDDPTAYDSSITLTADERTAYFYSDRAGTMASDLLVATRPDAASPWTASLLPAVNSASLDAEPAVNADGTELMFASSRPGGQGGEDLYLATRADADDDFTVVGAVTALSSTADDYHPFLQPGSAQLWFSSDRNGHFEIFEATDQGSGAYSAPVAHTELALATSNDSSAVVTDDGLAMYFRSDRTGALGGSGDYDIYLATRITTAAPFEPPQPVLELSSTAVDTPGWLSPDRCRLYMSSSRSGNGALFVATRQP